MIYLAVFAIGFMVGVIVMALARDWQEIFNFEATAYDVPIFSAVDEKPRLILVADRKDAK